VITQANHKGHSSSCWSSGWKELLLLIDLSKNLSGSHLQSQVNKCSSVDGVESLVPWKWLVILAIKAWLEDSCKNFSGVIGRFLYKLVLVKTDNPVNQSEVEVITLGQSAGKRVQHLDFVFTSNCLTEWECGAISSSQSCSVVTLNEKCSKHELVSCRE